METKQILIVGSMLLSITSLNAMEQPHGLKRKREEGNLVVTEKKSKTTKDLARNLGDLQRLPDDVIAQILLHATDSKSATLQEAVSALSNIDLTNNYIHTLIHDRRQLKDRYDQLKLEQKLARYKREHAIDEYDSRSALHLAIVNIDSEFLKGVLPELARRNMIEEFVNNPLDRALDWMLSDLISPWADRTWNKDPKGKEIIDIFLNNGARYSRFYLLKAVQEEEYDIARILLKHGPCDDIKENYISLGYIEKDSEKKQKTRELFRENHQCSECKFE